MKIKGLRKQIAEIEPYSAGKAAEEVMREMGLTDIIKIGSNENPYGPFPAALAAMKLELTNTNRYPDINFGELRKLLGRMYDLSSDYISLSHGAEAMLQTLGRCFIEEGDEVIIPEVTYTLYGEISKLMGATVVTVTQTGFTIDIEKIIAAVSPQTKLIWLANPNNPTSTVFEADRFEQLLDALPSHTWVILDEAYIEFAPEELLPPTIDYIRADRPVISIRTFSKVYGMAGMRLGYVIANPQIIAAINSVSEPFNANRPAVAGAMAVLTQDRDEVTRSRDLIIADRKRLAKKLKALRVRVVPTCANFIFFETDFNAESVSSELLKQGIIVRPCGVWGCPKAIRVTVGTTEQVNLFLEAMETILARLAISP